MREQVIVWRVDFEGIEFSFPDEEHEWSHKCSNTVLVRTKHLGIFLGVFMESTDNKHVDFLSDCDREFELKQIKDWAYI